MPQHAGAQVGAAEICCNCCHDYHSCLYTQSERTILISKCILKNQFMVFKIGASRGKYFLGFICFIREVPLIRASTVLQYVYETLTVLNRIKLAGQWRHACEGMHAMDLASWTSLNKNLNKIKPHQLKSPKIWSCLGTVVKHSWSIFSAH